PRPPVSPVSVRRTSSQRPAHTASLAFLFVASCTYTTAVLAHVRSCSLMFARDCVRSNPLVSARVRSRPLRREPVAPHNLLPTTRTRPFTALATGSSFTTPENIRVS
ncbi:hypothetical protein RHS03_07481, partial [Rhizoctonia solani]